MVQENNTMAFAFFSFFVLSGTSVVIGETISAERDRVPVAKGLKLRRLCIELGFCPKQSLKLLKHTFASESLDEASAQRILGKSLFEFGRYAEAGKALQSALSIREKKIGSRFDRSRTISWRFGGTLSLKKKNFQSAEDYLQRALKIREQKNASDSLDMANIERLFADLSFYRDELDEAEAQEKQAIPFIWR